MITIGLNKIYKRLLDHETHVSIIINDEVDNLIKLDFRGTPHYNTKTLYYREIVASCIEEVSKNPRLKSIDIYRYVSQRELLPLLDSNINIMKISILSAPYVPFLKKMRSLALSVLDDSNHKKVNKIHFNSRKFNKFAFLLERMY